MKKLLIACSMISAGALIACADGALTPQAWFDATTSSTNGGTLAVSGDALCEVITDSNKFEIDSDLENPVTFTPNATFAQSVAKVSFNLDAAVVPFGALQTFETEAPKVAFALYQSNEPGTATNFMAWVGGSDWIALSGATIPDEGNPYTLIMEFDNQTAGSNKVRFSIGQGATTNVLYGTGADAGNWFASTNRVTGPVAVNFVGCGKVTSFVGQQFIVGGEIVVIGDKGKVVVNADAEGAFEKTIPTGDTVETFLAKDAKTAFGVETFKSELKVGEAYALGLLKVDTDGKMVPRDNGQLKVVADAQASTKGGIPVKLNIVPPTDSGATITYQVKGSADGTDYVNVGAPVTDKDQIKIPTDDVDGTEHSYRFFKVITNVKLQDAPDPTPTQD